MQKCKRTNNKDLNNYLKPKPLYIIFIEFIVNKINIYKPWKDNIFRNINKTIDCWHHEKIKKKLETL